jgi:hypothetical protein
MGIFADAERDDEEVEIERQLDAAIGEIEIEIGFRSSVEVRVSRHPEGDLDVTLANPNAKEEALGSSGSRRSASARPGCRRRAENDVSLLAGLDRKPVLDRSERSFVCVVGRRVQFGNDDVAEDARVLADLH